MGLNLERTNISHSRLCKGGPVSKNSFRLVEVWYALAEESYTILILVALAGSVITGLCGREHTLSLTVSFTSSTSTFSMISLAFYSRIMLS